MSNNDKYIHALNAHNAQANELKPMLHRDHAKPRTRRDFLAQGFMRGSTSLMGLSLLGFMGGRSTSAFAALEDCNLGSNGPSLPVLFFDLAGGASIAGGNVCAGGPGGALDTAEFNETGWVKFGHPGHTRYNANGDNVDSRLGLPFEASSPMLAGIAARATEGTMANVNGNLFAAISDNDTANNLLNPCYTFARTGLSGSITTFTGSRANRFGGNSRGPNFDINKTPTLVNSANQARNLLSVGQIAEVLNGNQANVPAVLEAVEALSRKRISNINADELTKHLLGCKLQAASLSVEEGAADKLDASQDEDIIKAFGNVSLTGETSLERTANATKLVMDGYAGGATIEIEGYDYHDGTRVNGDLKDNEAGQCIGAALEYAKLKGQPLMIYVFSDGSVTGADATDSSGKYIWQADESSTAGTFLLYFDPAGRVEFKRHQIGNYTRFGSVDVQSRISKDLTALCEAATANYLALSGRFGEFTSFYPNSALGRGNDVEKYLGVRI